METKIKSVTVVSARGIKEYIVGHEVNGLIIDRIIDNSKEYPNSIEFIYEGITKDNNTLFSVINAPVDVQYEPVEAIKHPCVSCGKEWDQSQFDECPHCGNVVPF